MYIFVGQVNIKMIGRLFFFPVGPASIEGNLALPDSYARAVRDGSEGVWGSAYTKSVLMNLIINAK